MAEWSIWHSLPALQRCRKLESFSIHYKALDLGSSPQGRAFKSRSRHYIAFGAADSRHYIARLTPCNPAPTYAAGLSPRLQMPPSLTPALLNTACTALAVICQRFAARYARQSRRLRPNPCTTNAISSASRAHTGARRVYPPHLARSLTRAAQPPWLSRWTLWCAPCQPLHAHCALQRAA